LLVFVHEQKATDAGCDLASGGKAVADKNISGVSICGATRASSSSGRKKGETRSET
jgi:hypothetical protein